MTRAARAEGRAWGRRHHRLGEDPFGEGVAAPELRDVRKYVEGATGKRASDADLRKPRHQEVPPGPKLRHHGVDALLGALEGRHPRPLDEGGGVGDGVGEDPVHPLHHLLGPCQIAEPPAGHGVALGEAVDGDGPLLHPGEGADAEVILAVDDLLVDLVG